MWFNPEVHIIETRETEAKGHFHSWVHTTIRSIRDFSQKCMTQEGPNSRVNIVKNGMILTKTLIDFGVF